MRLTLTSTQKKNTGLIISPEELLTLYFYGVEIESKDGTIISNDTIEMYIRSAQTEIENFLSIKLNEQLITENKGYNRNEYFNDFPVITTSLPVNKPLLLNGFINDSRQITYPPSWLTSQFISTGFYSRRMSVVPSGTASAIDSTDVIFTGVMTQIGLQAYKNVPDYWTIQYITGFGYDNIPFDILNVVGKLASIGLFNIAGDLILGAGIASISLGVDGLSQSLSSTSSATNAGYGARIQAYTKEVNESVKRIKDVYKDITVSFL